MELRLSGLVVKQQGNLRVYNRIYECVFNQRWVDKALADIRPYGEALAAWLASNCQDESRLLRGQALWDARTWAVGKSLSEQDYQFITTSQELDKREVQQKLDLVSQELQETNQLKNLANISQELRTPFNAIIGCLRLVRDGYCDDRKEELDFLQRADDAAIHLLGLINDVLDIAEITAGTLSVEMEPIDFRKVLKEVIDLQAVVMQQKGLCLNLSSLQEQIPVQADPAKLKQVLLNVIGNAIKFTERGSITIATRIQSLAENQDGSNSACVILTVQDTGIGIDPTHQHKLFRAFVTTDGTTTRKHGGIGLGLAISRNLIELMEGSITLYSAGVDQGTIVEISLPVIDSSM